MSMKFLKSAASYWKKVSGDVVVKDTDADVGIGTTSPSTKLHVQDDTASRDGHLLIENTNADAYSAGIKTYKNTASPSGSDDVFFLRMTGRNDNSQDVDYGTVQLRSMDVTDGSEDGQLNFNVMRGGTGSTILRLTTDVTVNAGNLVIGTAGAGIDFSAQTPAAGMTAELLNHYEEGTWTPAPHGAASATFSSVVGEYTRIGNMVYAGLQIVVDSNSDTNTFIIAGLPFTATSNEAKRGGVAQGWQNSGNDYIGNMNVSATTFSIYANDGTSYGFDDWSTDYLKATFIYHV